jgi:hypothetical protein
MVIQVHAVTLVHGAWLGFRFACCRWHTFGAGSMPSTSSVVALASCLAIFLLVGLDGSAFFPPFVLDALALDALACASPSPVGRMWM